LCFCTAPTRADHCSGVRDAVAFDKSTDALNLWANLPKAKAQADPLPTLFWLKFPQVGQSVYVLRVLGCSNFQYNVWFDPYNPKGAIMAAVDMETGG
jgi:hypothetical protein